MLHDTSQRPSVLLLLLFQFATLLISVSMGMNAIIFPVSMENLGYSETIMGMALAGETISLLFVCFSLQWILRKFGLASTIIMALILRCLSLYFVTVSAQWYQWLGYIFVHGLGAYTMVLFLQIVVTSMPFTNHRTLINAMYGVMISLGYSIGPFLVEFADKLTPLLVASGVSQIIGHLSPAITISMFFSVVAGIVLMLGIRSSLSDDGIASRGLFSVVKSSPGVYWAIAYCGLVLFGITAFITIYGIRNDMPVYTASLLLVAFISGGIVLEPVYAWASKFFELRHFLFTNIFASLLFSAFLPLVIYSFPQSVILLFFWGGANASCYSVAISILSSRFKAEEMVAANSAFSLMDGVGGTFGIALIGISMNYFGSEGLAYVIMLGSILYFSYGLSRYRVI